MLKSDFNKGLLLTSLGSFWWGFIGVIYFEYVSFIGHIELVVHRCLWTAVMLIITTTFLTKWKFFFKEIKNKKKLFALFLSGLLIFINWSIWIYAVATDRIIDASFGYFIMPIISVLLGYIFFKEKLNQKRILSIALVTMSVMVSLASSMRRARGPGKKPLALHKSINCSGSFFRVSLETLSNRISPSALGPSNEWINFCFFSVIRMESLP